MAKHIDKAEIFVDMQYLFKIIYDAQFEAPKRDRIALINRILDHIENMMGYFAVSYQTEGKLDAAERLIAEFTPVKIECRIAIEKEMFKKESTITAIRERIVKIEKGIERWYQYVVSFRQEPHLEDDGQSA